MVGGSTWSRSAMMQATASTAPAPPNVCPVIDFVDEIGVEAAASPMAILIAAVSVASLASVDVPWALMYPMSEGSSPASFIALTIALEAPLPPGRGRVM